MLFLLSYCYLEVDPSYIPKFIKSYTISRALFQREVDRIKRSVLFTQVVVDFEISLLHLLVYLFVSSTEQQSRRARESPQEN